mmetsp:Transcript_34171/g.73719  ORF Transcript_34171/g.73719 Transcript_34171/m.73719 type:complete len:83 (+) Transcript_34171:737-985(+)
MGAASRATATHHTVWHHTRTPLHLTSSTTKFDSHSVWQVAFAVWWFVMRKKNPTQVEVVDPIQKALVTLKDNYTHEGAAIIA